MFELGPVVFNTNEPVFWIGMALWFLVNSIMPKRAALGITFAIIGVIIYYVTDNPTPGAGEHIYVDVVFWLGWLFTCMMSPLMLISGFIGWKLTDIARGD